MFSYGSAAFPGWDVAADLCVKVEEEWLCVQLRPEDHRQKSVAWEMALAAFRVVLGSGAHVRRMRGVNQEFMQARGLASGLPAGVDVAADVAAAAALPDWAAIVDVATRGYDEEHGSDEDTTDEEDGDEEDGDEEDEEYEEEDTESDASSTSGEGSGDESDMA